MANILIVGKDYPESEHLIKSFELQGHKIFTTTGSDLSSPVETTGSENIFSFAWNKASSISSRSLMVQAESKLVNVDRVLVVFDAQYYAKKYETERIEDCTMAIENMISGYVYFCQTLLTRLSQKNAPVQIGFYLKTTTTRADLVSSKNVSQATCVNTVAIAQGTFRALTENFGASFCELPDAEIFMCYTDHDNELYVNDRDTGSWINSYFDALGNLKTKQSPKQALSWVKTGSKMPGGFGLLRK